MEWMEAVAAVDRKIGVGVAGWLEELSHDPDGKVHDATFDEVVSAARSEGRAIALQLWTGRMGLLEPSISALVAPNVEDDAALVELIRRLRTVMTDSGIASWFATAVDGPGTSPWEMWRDWQPLVLAAAARIAQAADPEAGCVPSRTSPSVGVPPPPCVLRDAAATLDLVAAAAAGSHDSIRKSITRLARMVEEEEGADDDLMATAAWLRTQADGVASPSSGDGVRWSECRGPVRIDQTPAAGGPVCSRG